MARIIGAALFLAGMMPLTSAAQDTLPKFSAVSKGNNRIIISWTNAYPYTSQLSIQRSVDSLKDFKTILTVPDPSVPQNGFVDTRASTPFMFYRMFIVLDSGKYLFSKSKRPAPDTAQAILPSAENKRLLVSDSMTTKETQALKEKLQPAARTVVPKPEKFFTVIRRDTLLPYVSEKGFKKFRDSIMYSTKDTLVFSSVDTILIRPFVAKEVYKASKFVFTEKYGNVMIALPDAPATKYAVLFFQETNAKKEAEPFLEIKHVKAASLILDKTNFMHAGWFWFELYEEGKLKEKNKLFIPKDF